MTLNDLKCNSYFQILFTLTLSSVQDEIEIIRTALF